MEIADYEARCPQERLKFPISELEGTCKHLLKPLNIIRMQQQINYLYRFGPFLLDAAERLLLREGKIVPLSPKVIETLLVLVENSGRILGKDELMQTLWPDSWVEESNLTQNISQIRKALGEGEWIETIPKRGYRFAAPVQNAAPGDQEFVDEALLNQAAVLISTPPNGHNDDHSNPESVLAFDSQESQSLSNDARTRTLPKINYRLAAVIFLALIISTATLFFAYRRLNTQAGKVFQPIRLAKLTTSGQALNSAISHDGKYAVYVEGTEDAKNLVLRQISTTSQTVISQLLDAKILGLTFSPDDSFIFYVSRPKGELTGELFQIPLLGGAPKKILSAVDSPITISPDGQFVSFIRKDPAQKETALLVAKLDNAEEHKLLTRKKPDVISLFGPSWSPNGKFIACAAGMGIGGEAALQILTVDPKTGAARPIGTQSWSDVGQVAWLSDGSGLIFNAWRSSSAIYGDPLWLLTYPQGKVRQITSDLTTYDGISLSPNSDSIVSRQLSRVSRLWIQPADSGLNDNSSTQILSGFGDNFSDQLGLDWLPDGRLIFASHASGNLDIWVTNRDGQQQQLTRDRHTDVRPTVSADGRYIVFVSDRGGAHAIWRMDADGNNQKQLTPGKGDFAPSLSPDGKWVIYSSINNDHPTIWRVSIDGGEPVQLTEKTTFLPIVSPDGKTIACFYQDEKDFKNKLAIMPFSGGELTLIDTLAFPDHGNIRWMPNSRALCYIVTRQGISNLWQSPINNSAPSQLTNFTSDQIFRFAWSRDGKYLACERGLNISDVILITTGQSE